MDPRTIVLNYFELILGKAQIELIPELVADDAVIRVPFQDEPLSGRAGTQWLVELLHSGFSDVEAHVRDCISDGSTTAIRCFVKGNHTGDFLGYAPTGLPVRVQLMAFFLIQDDRIAEGWLMDDHLSLIRQISG